MLQKLKTLPIIQLALLLVIGAVLSFGPGPQKAFADSMTVSFDCQDGTTAFSAAPDTKNHQVVVTCDSGALMDYINFEGDGIQPVAVSATCPGSEKVGTAVDTPNQPTHRYVLYCVNITGVGDHATATRTNDTPTTAETTPPNVKCPDGTTPKDNDVQNCPVSATTDPAGAKGKCANLNNCDLITKYLNPFINFLAALVGLAVVMSIVVGGIQYGSSAGDSAKVTMAKNRIRNALIALVTFLFLYTLLNFLVPGGLF